MQSENIERFVDCIEISRQEHSVRLALRRLAEQIGCDYFAYMKLRGRDIGAISDYPPDWANHYLAKNYAAIDPVVTKAKRMMQVCIWSINDFTFARSTPQGAFLRKADQFGLRSGIAIPIRIAFGGTGILAFVSSQSRLGVKHIDASRALTATTFLHMKLMEIGRFQQTSVGAGLTPREVLCLTWASFGRSMRDTAAILEISERTVRFYLDQAREKLSARDIKHAIRIAVENGLI